MNPAAEVNSCYQEMRTFVHFSAINALVLEKQKKERFQQHIRDCSRRERAHILYLVSPHCSDDVV